MSAKRFISVFLMIMMIPVCGGTCYTCPREYSGFDGT
jgi:hypothetical protein